MKKGWIIWLILGLLLIAAALGLVLYNYWDSERAGKESAAILDKLVETIAENVKLNQDKTDEKPGTDPDGNGEAGDEQINMPTVLIDGYEYIGTIEIPEIRVHLPVMAKTDLSRLKTAPCRYSGSYFENNLVICGHNYGEHFSRIKTCRMGIDVRFTTVDGIEYHYIMSRRETVEPRSVDQMITGDDWDLTLFTCNTGGNTRCAVRCVLADGD